MLKHLFQGFNGSVWMRLWNGTSLKLGNAEHDDSRPQFTLICRSPGVVRSMVLGRDPLRLAEAYFRGDIDVEGDFFAALSLKDHLRSIRMSSRDRLSTLLAALRLPSSAGEAPNTASDRNTLHGRGVKAHSKSENRDAIAFHYDVSNEFYALWLDEAMVYSCAYFESPAVDLAQAQQAKLDHICRKLQLKPGEGLLDIGCGWGTLIIHAAQHYGVHATGSRSAGISSRRHSNVSMKRGCRTA